MLSRAAAEQREQIAQAGGSSLLSIGNSRGASPSAHSDNSDNSCNGRLSSPPPPEDNNNNNNNRSGQNSDNNNNTNGNANSVGNYNGKLSVNDVLRSQTSGHLHQQYQQVVDAITAAQNQNSCNGLGNPTTSAAQAVVNLAVAMRHNQPMSNGNEQSSPSHYHQNNQSMGHHGHQQQHHHGEPTDAALRIQDVLRSQAEAVLRRRLTEVSQAAAVVASNGNGLESPNHQYRHNGSSHNSYNNLQGNPQFTPEALRMQEQRLEQALRLHGSELGLHQGLHQGHHQNQP